MKYVVTAAVAAAAILASSSGAVLARDHGPAVKPQASVAVAFVEKVANPQAPVLRADNPAALKLAQQEYAAEILAVQKAAVCTATSTLDKSVTNASTFTLDIFYDFTASFNLKPGTYDFSCVISRINTYATNGAVVGTTPTTVNVAKIVKGS